MSRVPRIAAKLSQFETTTPRARVVVLGASNLSLTFPHVVERALDTFGAPLELFVAKGFGRSYGQQSKFFGKKFPGILQCDLWSALKHSQRAPTYAIIADVGNDLAYQAPVDSIVAWVEEAIERLAAHDAKIVLNNVPLASLRSVGAARYRLFKELFFPNCKVPRTELLRRAEELSESLERVGVAREIPVFSGDLSWYGLDPIHPRRAASHEIWRRMFAALPRNASSSSVLPFTLAQALALRRLNPAAWSHFGLHRRASQPAARLVDRTTISLF
jgi:hypothetical protein